MRQILTFSIDKQQLRTTTLSIVASTLFYYMLARAQDLIFPHTEFMRGIGWVYLPAGARLLCPLLLGLPGTIGVVIGSWIICLFYLYPDDLLRSIAGGLSSGLAPYVVYLLALRYFGMQASLSNLTSRRLLLLVPVFGVASPSMHHLWFWLHGDTSNLAKGFVVMSIGDMAGALLVLYGLKLCVMLLMPNWPQRK